MNRSKATVAAIAAAALLSGCTGGWWPFGLGAKPRDPAARIPPGATQYLCEGNKRLLVRHTADGKSAWVIYPDREFRLDRAAADGERYTNGITTLSVQGEETVLEENGQRLFAGCKRGQGS